MWVIKDSDINSLFLIKEARIYVFVFAKKEITVYRYLNRIHSNALNSLTCVPMISKCRCESPVVTWKHISRACLSLIVLNNQNISLSHGHYFIPTLSIMSRCGYESPVITWKHIFRACPSLIVLNNQNILFSHGHYFIPTLGPKY